MSSGLEHNLYGCQSCCVSLLPDCISISLSRLIYALPDLLKINWSVFTIRKFWQNNLILIYIFGNKLNFNFRVDTAPLYWYFKINFPSGLAVFQHNWPYQHCSTLANCDSTLCLRCWWEDQSFRIKVFSTFQGRNNHKGSPLQKPKIFFYKIVGGAEGKGRQPSYWIPLNF